MAYKSTRSNAKNVGVLLIISAALYSVREPVVAQNQTTTPSTSAALPSPQNPSRLGPAVDPVMRRQAMLGRWFGESKTSDGRTLRWVTERENSGTYRTDYLMGLTVGDSVPEESTELGQWGLSGSIFFTIQRAWAKNGETQRADPGNVYSYDAYELISINERTIEYASAGTGKRFMVRRVGQDFQLNPRQLK